MAAGAPEAVRPLQDASRIAAGRPPTRRVMRAHQQAAAGGECGYSLAEGSIGDGAGARRMASVLPALT